jgi:hypothetical protein
MQGSFACIKWRNQELTFILYNPLDGMMWASADLSRMENELDSLIYILRQHFSPTIMLDRMDRDGGQSAREVYRDLAK